MVVIGLLIVLFALFFLVRKHTGPATLAMIAGVSVYQAFNGQFVEMIHKMAGDGAPDVYLKGGLCFALIVVFPILLYLRSYSGGLFGILRLAEAAVLAALMALLVAPAITSFDFLAFDNLSKQVVEFIKNYEAVILLVGVVTAYFDLLMYRE